MKPAHIALALLMVFIWGVNFVAIEIGLESYPPLLLAALRFAIAAIPALFLPRPALSWPALISIAATLFVGQYGFLFIGMAHGMPPGLASIVMPIQVFLTILIAFLVLGETPTPRQIGGSVIAFVGLGAIATTIGGMDATTAGLLFTLAAALSWAIGNVLLRRAGSAEPLALISWLCVISVLPLLVLSGAVEGPAVVGHALSHPHWSGIWALLFIAVLSTSLGFGIWGYLLKLYPAASVAPFVLLVPVFGTVSAAIFFREAFSATRLAGMALILVGLAVVVLPVRRRVRPGVT